MSTTSSLLSNFFLPKNKQGSIVITKQQGITFLHKKAYHILFYQPVSAKDKSAWVLHSQFYAQYYTQLYQYTQLEVTPNFYTLNFMLCASKISANLLS